MSLHDIAAGAISSINPMMRCQWYRNIGATTAVGGARTPLYAAMVYVNAQVQQLSYADMKHANDLNMSGITRKVWCDAILSGVDRAAGTGGDRIVLPDGTAWLVIGVSEVWPDWCTALLQKQVA